MIFIIEEISAFYCSSKSKKGSESIVPNAKNEPRVVVTGFIGYNNLDDVHQFVEKRENPLRLYP